MGHAAASSIPNPLGTVAKSGEVPGILEVCMRPENNEKKFQKFTFPCDQVPYGAWKLTKEDQDT
jgi:hypothetical protein